MQAEQVVATGNSKFPDNLVQTPESNNTINNFSQMKIHIISIKLTKIK